MPTIINADTATGGAIITGDTSGQLQLQSGGVTALTTTGANVAIAGSLTVAGGVTGVNLSASVTGTLGVANGGTGVNTSTGTGSVVLSASPAFTGAVTFGGSSSQISSTFPNIKETTTVSATAATGTINYDVATQSVLYYTTNASANFTVNIRASSGTTLNAAMSTGEAITVAFLVTNGATAYYNNAFQVDGSSVTPKWQGGTAPTTGNINSIDIYTYTIIKTASATFTVLASQAQFK